MEGEREKKRERELVAICKRTGANGTHDFSNAQLGSARLGSDFISKRFHLREISSL